MSNAMAVLIDRVVQRETQQSPTAKLAHTDAASELERQLREWQKRCAICVVRERKDAEHVEWRECPYNDEDRRVTQQAWQALEGVRFEATEGCKGCWSPREVRRVAGKECEFAGVARDAGAALLGLQADRVGDWMDAEAAKAGLAVKEEESE